MSDKGTNTSKSKTSARLPRAGIGPRDDYENVLAEVIIAGLVVVTTPALQKHV